MNRKERRAATPELDQVRGDRTMKLIIVGTICFIAVLLVATLCACVLMGFEEIPNALENVTYTVVGGILTILAKTGADALSSLRGLMPGEAMPVKTEPGDTVATTDADPVPDPQTEAGEESDPLEDAAVHSIPKNNKEQEL